MGNRRQVLINSLMSVVVEIGPDLRPGSTHYCLSNCNNIHVFDNYYY